MKVVGIVKEICFLCWLGNYVFFFCKDYYFNSLFELYESILF